jgi:hypothetical protein
MRVVSTWPLNPVRVFLVVRSPSRKHAGAGQILLPGTMIHEFVRPGACQAFRVCIGAKIAVW